MKKMKLITFLLSAALIAASFAGCGSSASAEPDNSSTKQEQPPVQDQKEPMAKETIAKIVSMEGNTITVIPADMPEGRDDQSLASEPAIDSGGQTPEPELKASEPALIDEGQKVGESGLPGQSGEPAPDGRSGQPGRALEFTGDEITYTLSDSVKVTRGDGKDAAEIDLSEIAADSIIMFATGEEGGSEVITSIRVLDQAE